MTDSNFCCLCASDEGVFLDIFTDATDRQLGNRSFLKEFETCLSVKVKRDEAISSTICHRCAIELGQCYQFVEKYRQVCGKKFKKVASKKYCCLCLSTDQKHHIFTLAKDFRSTIDPLQKIFKCFNRQITREEAEYRSICLLCRYNLDVLYDLKTLASEVTSKLESIAKSKAILANLPKTKTFVVNRKTTVTSKSEIELQTLLGSESENGTMSRRQSKSQKLETLKSGVELKLRICGQCHTTIEGGIDMYRLHSTGLTVCKMCWITMDPFNPSKNSKRKRQNEAEGKNTRLCTVFLKDVLSTATSRNDGPLKVEKEDPIYIISDDSSDGEGKSDVVQNRSLRTRRTRGSNGSDEGSDARLRQSLKRNFRYKDTGGVTASKKKLKSIKNEATTVSLGLRKNARYQSSDSDSVKPKGKRGDSGDVKNEAESSAKVNNVHSADKNSKIKPNKNVGKRKGANAAESGKSKSEDSASSSDSGVGRKLRKVRNKVPLILEPELPDSQKSKKNLKRSEPRSAAPTLTPAVSKNSSLQFLTRSQSSKVKPSSKRAKTLMMVSFPFKLKDPYECKVCRKEYKNKVVGMKHELTHFKQVEIKIEKLNIPRHFQNVNENSTTNQLPNADCSIDLTTSNEKLPPSEVPTSTSPPGSDEDQGTGSDHQTEEAKTVQRSKTPEPIQQDEKSPDIEDVKETDGVSSSNGLLAEESTLVEKDSNTKTTENVEPGLESTDGLKKVDTSSCEVDSATEVNTIDENGVPKESNEILDENVEEKLVEDSDKSSNETEGTKEAEKKSDEEAVAPSSKTGTDNKDVEKDGDSGEEMESDIDIRIVDSGSSAEDSSEQMEKRKDDTVILKNVLPKIDTEETPVNAKEDSEPKDENKDVLNDDQGADITSTNNSDNNIDAKNKSDDLTSSQKKEDSKNECEASELSEKIEKDAKPLNDVTEILQEVIDLATAEVKKRVESEVTSLPETVENISEEIKKSAETPAPDEEIVASLDVAMETKEADSSKLDSNCTAKEVTDLSNLDSNSTTNSLKNHVDVSTTDV